LARLDTTLRSTCRASRDERVDMADDKESVVLRIQVKFLSDTVTEKRLHECEEGFCALLLPHILLFKRKN